MSIDLSKLPPPLVIEKLSYQSILNEMILSFENKMKEVSPDYVLSESDPAMKILEVAARREVGLRARINDAAKECMLAYASNANLEQIVALLNVERKTLSDLDEFGKNKKESDDSLRMRALQSFDQFSTAGAEAGYIYQARKVGTELGLVDVKAFQGDKPGEINITLLFEDHSKLDLVEKDEEGNEVKTSKVSIIKDHLLSSEVKPLTDVVTVNVVTVKSAIPKAKLFIQDGVDSEIVRKEAFESLKKYADERYRIGANITLAGIYGALTVPNVWDVELTGVTASIKVSNFQAYKLEVIYNNLICEV